MIKVKLLKPVLVQSSDVIATERGTVVSMPEDRAKEFIAAGLAEEPKAEKQKAPAPVEYKRARK